MPGGMAESNAVIIGAGAMGGVFGACLAQAGVDATAVDADPGLVEAINDRGVTLIEGESQRTVRLPATTDVASLPDPDVVFLFVKCHHTKAAAEAVRPRLRPSTRVVTLQNGWGNADVLASLLGEDRVVVGVTYTSATTVEPAVIRTSGPARTVLGPLAGPDSLADPVASALEAAGFPVERPQRVLDEIWKKLVLNAATLPTAALTGLSAGKLASTGDMRWLVDAAAAEAVEVGRAQGFEVALDERLESIHSVLDSAGSGKGSMLQDVEAGRRTEIDVISGAVLRRAREHGIDTPVTRALYALVSGWETAREHR